MSENVNRLDSTEKKKTKKNYVSGYKGLVHSLH